MEKKSITVEEFIQGMKSVKLTDPQKKVLKRLEDGYRLRTINAHWQNGGEMVWVSENGNEYPASHIYKAYCNLRYYKSRPVFGNDFEVTGMWV